MDNKVFLFPLNNAILFKKVTLPFHIFEERYKQMVEDSIAMQIPIAVVHYDSSNRYQSEICVAGLPHILATYPDGRMDIYITGTVKCYLTHFEEENPYKIYSYRTLDENMRNDVDLLDIELTSLKTLLQRWSLHFLPDPNQRDAFTHTLEDPEVLVNYCSVFLVDEIEIKRAVMEAENLQQKVRVLLQAIGPKEISLGPFMPTLKF